MGQRSHYMASSINSIALRAESHVFSGTRETGTATFAAHGSVGLCFPRSRAGCVWSTSLSPLRRDEPARAARGREHRGDRWTAGGAAAFVTTDTTLAVTIGAIRTTPLPALIARQGTNGQAFRQKRLEPVTPITSSLESLADGWTAVRATERMIFSARIARHGAH